MWFTRTVVQTSTLYYLPLSGQVFSRHVHCASALAGLKECVAMTSLYSSSRLIDHRIVVYDPAGVLCSRHECLKGASEVCLLRTTLCVFAFSLSYHHMLRDFGSGGQYVRTIWSLRLIISSCHFTSSLDASWA